MLDHSTLQLERHVGTRFGAAACACSVAPHHPPKHTHTPSRMRSGSAISATGRPTAACACSACSSSLVGTHCTQCWLATTPPAVTAANADIQAVTCRSNASPERGLLRSSNTRTNSHLADGCNALVAAEDARIQPNDRFPQLGNGDLSAAVAARVGG